MLTELRVRDLAVIADVTLPLQSGLNVLTGETGAGKSMLVDALALLLGERASADVVRPGAQKTTIEGAFELTATALDRLSPPLTALGVEVEDGRVILKREITGEGRSRVWVNGSPATVGVLAQLGALLVDLHGQHETQSLLRPEPQRDILDAYAEAGLERTAVRDAQANDARHAPLVHDGVVQHHRLGAGLPVLVLDGRGQREPRLGRVGAAHQRVERPVERL